MYTMPGPCNVPSRTIFIGDNLDILRGINNDCVDLIYLDPPFNSDQTYAAPLNSEARGAEFDDVWTLSDMKPEWIDEIEYRRPALYHLINGAKLAHGESMAGYMTFMSIRLLELQRILKSTGSIYLHCDDTAVHYLKAVMDALFGEERYINNIVWKRATSHNDPKRFGRILDHLLFYSKGASPHWNPEAVITPKNDDDLRKSYPSTDDRGRYRYADADTGIPAQNLFLDPAGFTNYSTRSEEYTGWRTQKPVALLERLINASSKPGDLVLDPFCGCATACIAAEKLKRQWIGIDVLPQAADVLKDRAKWELQIPLAESADAGWEEWTPMVLNAPPRRNDLTLFSPVDPQSDKELLYHTQQGRCAGCLYELPLHVLTIDHITPAPEAASIPSETCNSCATLATPSKATAAWNT